MGGTNSRNHKFVIAIAAGNIEAVKRLVGKTPSLISQEFVVYIDEIIQDKSLAELTNTHAFTGVCCAAWCGNLAMVKWFVEHGASIDTIHGSDGVTGVGIRAVDPLLPIDLRSSALLCVLWSPRPMKDRHNLLVYLLDNGANINARTPLFGRKTALEIALEKENMTIAELLISRGASYDIPHPISGQTLIDSIFTSAKSSSSSSSSLFSFFMKLQGFNWNGRHRRTELTYLNQVANAGNTNAVLALLRAGANFDGWRWSADIFSSNGPMVTLLITHGLTPPDEYMIESLCSDVASERVRLARIVRLDHKVTNAEVMRRMRTAIQLGFKGQAVQLLLAETNMMRYCGFKSSIVRLIYEYSHTDGLVAMIREEEERAKDAAAAIALSLDDTDNVPSSPTASSSSIEQKYASTKPQLVARNSNGTDTKTGTSSATSKNSETPFRLSGKARVLPKTVASLSDVPPAPRVKRSLITSSSPVIGEWLCGRCDGRNEPQATHCGGCDTIRGTSYFPSIPPQIESKARQPKVRLEEGAAKRGAPLSASSIAAAIAAKKSAAKTATARPRRTSWNGRTGVITSSSSLLFKEGRGLMEPSHDDTIVQLRRPLAEVMRDDDNTVAPAVDDQLRVTSVNSYDDADHDSNDTKVPMMDNTPADWDIDAPSAAAIIDEWGNPEQIDTTNIDDLDAVTTINTAATIPPSAPSLHGESTGDVKELKDGKQSDTAADSKSMPSSSSIASVAPPLSRQKSYTVLRSADITERQKQLLSELTDVLSLSHSACAALLMAFNWRQQDLLDQWFIDSNACMTKAGLPLVSSSTSSPASQSASTITGDAMFDCPLCGTSTAMSSTYALPCGHRHCITCWTSWLEAAYAKGPEAIFTHCIEYQCPVLVDIQFFLDRMQGDARDKLEGWILRSFVKNNIYIKWCPARDCDKAVEYTPGGVRTVTCSCGHSFCFACGRDEHAPCACGVVQKWEEKTKQDGANVTWILANCKICPKCKTPIEKNQGCNHMTCKHCKHEFCWLCKKNWVGHSGSNCNQYQQDPDSPALLEEKQSDSATAELEKYSFYFSRYDNHAKAIQFALKTRTNAEQRMEEMQRIGGMTDGGVKFLINAVDSVMQCRRLLYWSYAMGFFLPDKSPVKLLFEQHQNRLETFTERLHGFSERPIESLIDRHTREDIINLTRVVEKYRVNVLDFCMANS